MTTTNKEAEKFAQMIAQMEDSGDLHRPPSKERNLEEEVRVLKFRNEKLHNYNIKLVDEVRELREDNKKLAREVGDKVNQLRKAGAL